MKVAVVADLDVTSWRPLRRVIDVLGAEDTLVTTGVLAFPALQMVNERKHAVRPELALVYPETGRYDRDEAARQRDMQLLGRHRPHALVLIGGPTGKLYPHLKELMESAEAHSIPIYDIEDFVKERER